MSLNSYQLESDKQGSSLVESLGISKDVIEKFIKGDETLENNNIEETTDNSNNDSNIIDDLF